jgi:hypothetical protein
LTHSVSVSDRARANENLLEQIRAIHDQIQATYQL